MEDFGQTSVEAVRRMVVEKWWMVSSASEPSMLNERQRCAIVLCEVLGSRRGVLEVRCLSDATEIGIASGTRLGLQDVMHLTLARYGLTPDSQANVGEVRSMVVSGLDLYFGWKYYLGFYGPARRGN